LVCTTWAETWDNGVRIGTSHLNTVAAPGEIAEHGTLMALKCWRFHRDAVMRLMHHTTHSVFGSF
jgi:hypothetical protein